MSVTGLERRLANVTGRMERTAAVELPADAAELAAVLGIAVDPWQRDVLTSGARQLIMLTSRQAGKSTCSALMATHQICLLYTSPSPRDS